jgi:hypothetical protein
MTAQEEPSLFAPQTTKAEILCPEFQKSTNAVKFRVAADTFEDKIFLHSKRSLKRLNTPDISLKSFGMLVGSDMLRLAGGGGGCSGGGCGGGNDVQQEEDVEGVPPCEYMTDEQARRELAETGETVDDLDTTMATAPAHAADDMEDLGANLQDHYLNPTPEDEELKETPVSGAEDAEKTTINSGPDKMAAKRKPGLLTATPTELKKHHPEWYDLMVSHLGEPHTASIPPVGAERSVGAESYGLIDALAQAQQHRREAAALKASDKSFHAFLSEGSEELLRFGLAGTQFTCCTRTKVHILTHFLHAADHFDADILAQVAAPDVEV